MIIKVCRHIMYTFEALSLNNVARVWVLKNKLKYAFQCVGVFTIVHTVTDRIIVRNRVSELPRLNTSLD
jgi:hypothetical protein